MRAEFDVRERASSCSRLTANGNYHRAYLREKRARHQAEEILETRSRELFEANARIETQYANLEAAHDQLKEAQGQLVQSEKMASVGQLAAGIAHEINNPMAFISSNLNTLSRTAERFAHVLREYESFVASVTADGSRAVCLVAGLRWARCCPGQTSAFCWAI